MLGRWPSSNSASNVEPITWEMRPFIVAVAIDHDPRNALGRTIGGRGAGRPLRQRWLGWRPGRPNGARLSSPSRDGRSTRWSPVPGVLALTLAALWVVTWDHDNRLGTGCHQPGRPGREKNDRRSGFQGVYEKPR